MWVIQGKLQVLFVFLSHFLLVSVQVLLMSMLKPVIPSQLNKCFHNWALDFSIIKCLRIRKWSKSYVNQNSANTFPIKIKKFEAKIFQFLSFRFNKIYLVIQFTITSFYSRILVGKTLLLFQFCINVSPPFSQFVIQSSVKIKLYYTAYMSKID